MGPDELLAAYDAELRREAEVADADEVTAIGPVLAATFPARGKGFVTYRCLEGLSGAGLDALIERVVAHYRDDERVTRFEWKTRGHDSPADLLDVLGRHGLVAEERETVMAGEAQAAIRAGAGLPEGYTLERTTTPVGLREAEAVAGRVFGDDPADSSAMADGLVRRFEREPDAFQMWAVRNPSGRLVCSGRVDFAATGSFASLWGGACEASERGRGLYRALTAARGRAAIDHGRPLLHSDCTEYSRPILERAGLVPITTTTPVMWRR